MRKLENQQNPSPQGSHTMLRSYLLQRQKERHFHVCRSIACGNQCLENSTVNLSDQESAKLVYVTVSKLAALNSSSVSSQQTPLLLGRNGLIPLLARQLQSLSLLVTSIDISSGCTNLTNQPVLVDNTEGTVPCLTHLLACELQQILDSLHSQDSTRGGHSGQGMLLVHQMHMLVSHGDG